jgi:hypothetical protein
MTFSHKPRAHLVVSHPSSKTKSLIQNDFWLRLVAIHSSGGPRRERGVGYAGYFMTSPLDVPGQEKISDR